MSQYEGCLTQIGFIMCQYEKKITTEARRLFKRYKEFLNDHCLHENDTGDITATTITSTISTTCDDWNVSRLFSTSNLIKWIHHLSSKPKATSVCLQQA